jgi:hypothetical protein
MGIKMKKKKMYRIPLVSSQGLKWSVFIKANNREAAERRALKHNPDTRIDHTLFPQN